jgi:hypothetical protein
LALAKFLDTVAQQSSINDHEIPVIVYMGPYINLPDIFEKLNSTGMKLSKYEIFAAAWDSAITRIDRDSIKTAIQKKYQQVVDDGFELAIEDSSVATHNLFEYLLGRGKHLTEKYPKLVTGANEASAVESVAFILACIANGLRINQMPDLPDHINSTDSIIDPALFDVALEEALDKVEDVFRPFTAFTFNSRSGASSINLTEYQLSSYVGRMLAAR